jgi:hypothetical protein
VTTPRRRVLRPARTEPALDPRQYARIQRRQSELAKRRAALRRWLTRLKRATNTVTDLHQRIVKLEADLAESNSSALLERPS